MGFFDRLFGSDQKPPAREPSRVRALSDDAQALERYRYMVQTAPPETIEQAHQEAFTRLTPEQRRQVLAELAKAAPAGERASVEATSSEDPSAMARIATRAEVRQPGLMERTLGGAGGGMGFGGSLLTSVAAGFVGSMVAQSFFSALGGFGDGGDAHGASDQASASNEAEGESDFGGDGGDFGGDGGDFGA